MVRCGAAYERRDDDDGHLKRLDLGSRKRVRVRAVNTKLVDVLLLLAAAMLNAINEQRRTF